MEKPAVLLRRLNPYCARALEEAASLCQTRAHALILPEHWLLKLLEQGEGDLTVLARRYKWDMEIIWQDLLNWLDNRPRSVRSHPQLSGPIKSLLKQAWVFASLEGYEQIRSAHLLAVMIDMPKLLGCNGLWPLLTLGQKQLSALRSLLDSQSDERPDIQLRECVNSSLLTLAQKGNQQRKNRHRLSESQLAVLDRFTLDLSARAKAGEIDPVFGREKEIRQMVDILSRRRKSNPILVGDPGVGKTAVVEGLALEISNGNVPDSLKAVSVRVLDLGLLQAGAGVKGEFEQRLKNVIEAVQQSPIPILLFIDEVHTLIGAGNQAGSADAANLLKPALARGELRTIAATTWREYRQYFERDAALERRFQRIKVEEPDDETACLMLRGLKSRYAKHHGVHITDDAVKAAVTLSRRYISARQLPDKAIDLLDTAAARVRISLDTLPDELTHLKAQIAALHIEKLALLADIALGCESHDERLTQIEQQTQRVNDSLMRIEAQYETEKSLTQQLLTMRQKNHQHQEVSVLQQQLHDTQGSTALLSLDVEVRTVAAVVADWTGIPLTSLLKDDQADLLRLEEHLSQRIVGQHQALKDMTQRIQAAKTGLSCDNSPLGVFLLVGPSGVGKTETARALVDTLFSGEESLITINMSEYQQAHTVSQLTGSPPGYVGYGQGGILTEAVRQRPYSVVLLDEVEKAHIDVINLFYQVFDRGMMRDGEGREIDFRNTIILMTSNLGSDLLMQQLEQQPETSLNDLHQLLYPLLRDYFQPALLARFQTLIYRPLDRLALRRIVEMKLAQVAKRLHKHYGVLCTFSADLYETLVRACLLPESGARNIDNLLNQQILPILSQQLLTLMAAKQPLSSIQLRWDEHEGIVLEFDKPAQ